jgi:hypothetical protein
MKTISLSEINILDVGNRITLCGSMYSGLGSLLLVPFPGGESELEQPEVALVMDPQQYERFLHQTDVLDIAGESKAVLRKSQRLIDRIMQWKVFERDDFRCRYCGKRSPLTVDHVILWENGGATVESNLISSCGKCNRVRGNTEYAEWLGSPAYRKISSGLPASVAQANTDVIKTLDSLRAIQANLRSR